MDYQQILKTPFVEVIQIKRAMASYNQAKSYEMWVDYEFSKEDNTDPKFKLKNGDKEDYRWSTWEIKSAMEYDLYVVPQLGDGAWGEMMAKGGIGNRK